MIKNLKGSGRYISGNYNVVNKEKYVGQYPVIYRSSWERQFCIYCDKNESIIKWSSESMEIPYISPVDNKRHRYYPDFYFEVKTINGDIIKYVAEVKPHSKLSRPKKPVVTQKILDNYNKRLNKYLVESKKNPNKKLKRPIKPTLTRKKLINYNRQLKDHINILAKAHASRIWCKNRGFKYVFLTERDWKKLFYKR